jgi:hypothetical protein
VWKVAVGLFALVGFIAVALALWLWFAAWPVFESARAIYAEIPAEAQCTGPYSPPPGYPVARREVQSLRSAENDVYRAACEAADLTHSCFHMTGAQRSVGYTIYRSAYLSDCQVRAISLHGQTPLRRSLELLYADRPVANLGEAELTCVANAMRVSHRGFCARYPSCCAVQEGLTPAVEPPR